MRAYNERQTITLIISSLPWLMIFHAQTMTTNRADAQRELTRLTRFTEQKIAAVSPEIAGRIEVVVTEGYLPDAKVLFFDPDNRPHEIHFTEGIFNRIPEDETMFLIGHEVGHIILDHLTNRKKEGPTQRQIKADLFGMRFLALEKSSTDSPACIAKRAITRMATYPDVYIPQIKTRILAAERTCLLEKKTSNE